MIVLGSVDVAQCSQGLAIVAAVWIQVDTGLPKQIQSNLCLLAVLRQSM